MPRAPESLEPFRHPGGWGALLYDAGRVRNDPALLEPASYGPHAQAIGEGGRGSAWFVRGAFGDAVLRHYRRGGLAARLSRDTYLWRGAHRTRCFREYRLLAELHAEGLPVPRPLAAGYLREGMGYRARLLIERLPGATPLGARLEEGDALPWEAIGALVARFHAARVFHADLNAHNILLGPDAGRGPVLWLVDFDRGDRRPIASGWRAANLARLERSLRKLAGGGAEARVGGWCERLRAGYERAWQARL